MKGYIWTDLGVLQHSFGTNFTTTVTKGKSLYIVNHLEYGAYGIVGSNGFGLVYTKNFSTTCHSQTCNMDEAHVYSALACYCYLYVKSTIYCTQGSMTVSPT